jgi:hypothetical protein
MTTDEWRRFLLTGSRTAKLATVADDGRPIVVPGPSPPGALRRDGR